MRLIGMLVLALVLTGCKSKEEVLAQEEAEGQFLAEKKGALLKGVGEGLQGKGKEGVETLSQGIGEVFKGAAKCFDKSLNAVQITTDASVASKGLKFERASHHRSNTDSSKHQTITAYVVFDQAFDGALQLRALDDESHEVGRASLTVKEGAGGAQDLDFAFDERAPVSTAEMFVLHAP